ncbi:hypothetical protein HUT18_18930 [Streptomyces sp. NA04227]|uniref:hypothetical protein n=1 Tax=Streptomyces sp. NA04227 TaxID=2742136 RepID=UPI001590546A|nr:hypothetical protein [Streptomyces sp. NA04227]QKW08140.1 hypothetical protein HUT18_18930 [Streptomyces sp. NA04227]
MSPSDEHGYGAETRTDDGFHGSGQTRTRLPERGGDPYASGNRRRSSTRGMATVVGVVVLLIAAIAFANRDTDDSGGSDEGGGDRPAAAPTAATGEKPVGTKTGTIPSGFGHDAQGAESAAANYAVALVSADIFKPARRSAIVQQIFVPSKVADLEEQFAKAYSKTFLSKLGLDENGNAPRGNTYISRTMPIGSKNTAYSDTAATVDVWCSGVFGTAGQGSTNPVTNDWFTMTLKLRWTGGDWKVESYSQKDGPAPVNGDNKISTAEEIAKAVDEYGGFTYAR